MSGLGADLQSQLADRLMRAVAALQQGDLDAAESLAQGVLDADPRHPVALHLLGAVRLQRDDLWGAADFLEDALAINPRSAAANCDLGLVHLKNGRLDDARTQFQRAADLRPDFPEAWFNLAQVALRQGDLAAAGQSLRQALARRPEWVEARLLLAAQLHDTGQPRAAEAELREVLRREPDSLPALRQLGRTLDTLGRRQEAIAALRRAVDLLPGDAEGWALLASTLTAFGDLDAAVDAYERAIALAPARAEWGRVLAMLTSGEADLADREQAFADPATPDDEKIQLGFGLGATYEKRGEFDRAFDALSTANLLKRRSISYLPTAAERTFADIEASFSAELFERHAAAGVHDPAPIFILGMPRSGTTLVEQILASHPDVFGAGELPLLRTLVVAAGGQEGSYRDLLDRMDDAALTRLGASYLRQLHAFAPQARHVTDKMPGNFMLIGFIRLCLPRAKVIHCVRDPLDTAFSLYRNFFSTNLGYAYDLEEVGHYHRLYRRLMAHWHRVLPGFVYDLSYEALVADQEAETRRLLDHVGLDFRPECLDFHLADRSVHTASAVQVRAPLNAGSIGLAAKYGARLDPLRRALDGA